MNKKIIIPAQIKIVLLTSLIVRLLLSLLPGFKIDTDAWFAWSLRLFEVGIFSFYQPGYFADYPPGFLYILWVLGALKSILSIDNQLYSLLLKVPSILAETIIIFWVYKIAIQKTTYKWALAATIGVAFNIGLIFNSSVWGQGDAFFSLFLILAVYYLQKSRFILSSFLIAFAFLLKPQSIALFPLFGLVLLTKPNIKKTLQLIVPGLALLFLLPLPFFLSNPILGLFELLIKTANQYHYTSLFAYNFWGSVGFWIDDGSSFMGLTFQLWGTLLFAAFWILLTFLYFKSKKKNFFIFASLALLGFFFLPTRVHERYLYPAIPFLFIAASIYKNRLLFYETIFLSGLYFINLYYVYIYYNEFYLQLPKTLYLPFFYETISDQGKLLSFISGFLFIIICATIVKHETR